MGGGWPPGEMNTMSFAELMRWHGIAIERNRRDIAAMQA